MPGGNTLPAGAGVGVLPLLRGGRGVLGQLQQALGPAEAFLVVGGEVTAAPADRLGLGDVEGGHVVAHGLAVIQLGVAVLDDVAG